MRFLRACVLLWIILWVEPGSVYAAVGEQLLTLREQISTLETGLLKNLQSRKNTQGQVRQIRRLIVLQKRERDLGEKRTEELKATLDQLELKQAALKEKLEVQQRSIRDFLASLDSSRRRELIQPQESTDAPRRKVLEGLVQRSIREMKALRQDLSVASELETQIQEERQHLGYLLQDLQEKASLLELNHQLQLDLLKRNSRERVAQLEKYQNLKTAEGRVEQLITQFSARKELNEVYQAEKQNSSLQFADLKGKLPFPVEGGKVSAGYGKTFDAQTGMQIFRKGLDILVDPSQPVRAIFGGRIAFAGNLPRYGQVVILDHGNHYYSICGQLGSILKKTNEVVAANDAIGMTGDSKSIYFEIRSRNIAVNPLQWVFN